MTNKSNFIDKFAKFYGEYFTNTSKTVVLLADIQKEFGEEYNAIKEFGNDSKSINELIEKLPPEKQNLLLKMLLKAGKFGKDMVNLFESSEEEKRELAKELKDFGDLITKEIITLKKISIKKSNEEK